MYHSIPLCIIGGLYRPAYGSALKGVLRATNVLNTTLCNISSFLMAEECGDLQKRFQDKLRTMPSNSNISIKEKTRTVNYAGIFIVLSCDDNTLYFITCNGFSSLVAKEANHDSE